MSDTTPNGTTDAEAAATRIMSAMNSMDAVSIGNPRDIRLVCEAVARLTREVGRLRAERDTLAKFKSYVHKRLDDAGVPVDPDSPHKAEGCRVGGRLDYVLAQRKD